MSHSAESASTALSDGAAIPAQCGKSTSDQLSSTAYSDPRSPIHTLAIIKWAHPGLNGGSKTLTRKHERDRSTALKSLFKTKSLSKSSDTTKSKSKPSDTTHSPRSDTWLPGLRLEDAVALHKPLFKLYTHKSRDISVGALTKQFDTALKTHKEVFGRALDITRWVADTYLGDIQLSHILLDVQSTLDSPSYAGWAKILDRKNLRRNFDRCHTQGECGARVSDGAVTLSIISYDIDNPLEHRKETEFTLYDGNSATIHHVGEDPQKDVKFITTLPSA